MYSEQLFCVFRWNEAFGESFPVNNYILAVFVVFYYIPILMLVILYSVIVSKLNSEKIPGEQSTNAEQQRAKRNRNVLKMAIAIVLGLVLCRVPLSIFSLILNFVWDSFPCMYFLYILEYFLVNVCLKLCHQSLHLFHFHFQLPQCIKEISQVF